MRLFPLLALWLLVLPGCTALGFLADAVVPKRIEAVYTLPEKTTLVLVDDRNNALGDKSLLSNIATQAGSDLVQVKALPQVIDQARLNELISRLGLQAYDLLPVDQVGRALGAQQVIFINLTEIAVMNQPGILKPTAQAYVKVIDVATGKPVFPVLRPGAEFAGSIAQLGYATRISMNYKADQQTDAILPVLRLRLAEEIGKQVAELFYPHKLPDKGVYYDQ